MLRRMASATRPTITPNVHPRCANVPSINDDGFEELCHLVSERRPGHRAVRQGRHRLSVEPAVAALRGLPGDCPRRDELMSRRSSAEPLLCVIEIPRGSRNKYEYDAALGAIKLDRFISASVVYPTDYGYVPETLAPDGDALDVLVCVSEPTFPGCVVPALPVGLFRMADENGPDDHVVCVPCNDPGWNTLRDVDDLPLQLRSEIQHFFSDLQGPRPRPLLRGQGLGRSSIGVLGSTRC